MRSDGRTAFKNQLGGVQKTGTQTVVVLTVAFAIVIQRIRVSAVRLRWHTESEHSDDVVLFICFGRLGFFGLRSTLTKQVMLHRHSALPAHFHLHSSHPT